MDKKNLIKIVSVFFYIFSAMSLILSLVFLFTLLIGGFAESEEFSKGLIIGLSVFMILLYLSLAGIYFLAAKYLWKFKKTGGLIALVLIILALMGSWVFLLDKTLLIVGLFATLLEIGLLVLLILGWKELK